KVVKGYYLEDFQPSWTRHLHQPCGTAAPGCDGSGVAADLQSPSTGISNQQPEANSPQLISSAVAAESAQSTNKAVVPARSGVAAQFAVEKVFDPTSNAVAADKQSPSPGNSGQQPVARSPQLARSAVAAVGQNPLPVISGQQLAARSPQLFQGMSVQRIL